MIDEAKQQVAIDYVLGELSPSEVTTFEAALASDQELRDFTKEITEAVACIALTTPPMRPSKELFSRIQAEVSQKKRSKLITVSFLPWALAACFAIAFLVLGVKHLQTGSEVAELRQRDALAHLQIAQLQAQVDAYAKTTAIIIWNAERQSGVARLQQLPAAPAGHDYQLWIIDPKEKAPVSAGIVPISTGNTASFEFKPEHPVTTAAKFAVSIEKAGGAPAPQGQIILIGGQ